jgi:protein-S-isoprenylcysteine O-methyltransferase Ste14
MSYHQKSRKLLKHRENLAGEHKFSDAGQLILFLVFMAVWITDSFFFKYSVFLNNYIPASVQITLGVIVLIISACLAASGIIKMFGKVREKSGVVRDGVFGIIRHPLYTSEMLLYLGLLLLSTSLAAIAVWVIGIAFLHYISRYEEKILLEQFADEYRQYMKDVPMYIPRLRRKKIM